MVLITCAVFVPTPVRMIRSTVLELLEGNPADSIREDVETRIDSVRNEFGLDPLTSRVTKVGPKLYVEIEGLIDGRATIADEHRVRQRLFDVLDEMSYDIWLNVELLPQRTRRVSRRRTGVDQGRPACLADCFHSPGIRSSSARMSTASMVGSRWCRWFSDTSGTFQTLPP